MAILCSILGGRLIEWLKWHVLVYLVGHVRVSAQVAMKHKFNITVVPIVNPICITNHLSQGMKTQDVTVEDRFDLTVLLQIALSSSPAHVGSIWHRQDSELAKTQKLFQVSTLREDTDTAQFSYLSD